MKIEIEFPEGYEILSYPIEAAIKRTALGKGKQRHEEYSGQSFSDQQIMRFSHGWRLDQIQKKGFEASHLPKRDAIGEIEDVIVYGCAEWLKLNKEITDAERERALRKQQMTQHKIKLAEMDNGTSFEDVKNAMDKFKEGE
jgi:hypothetical protein